ncbi:MAG: hypothetical protein IJ501_00790 [Bacilli bacterium]|nr:hypothetical protein [Bacilli bacterium]
MKKNKFIYITFFSVILLVISISIGYSVFYKNLSVENIGLQVRLAKDIRITGISVDASTFPSDGVSMGEDYSVSRIMANISLPEETSTITYKIQVTNFGNMEVGIYNITGLPDNLTYSLSDYSLKEVICDQENNCKLGVIKEFLLTIKYNQELYDKNLTEYNLDVNFEFRIMHNITYENIVNNNYPSYVMDGDTLNIEFKNSIPDSINIVNSDNSYIYSNRVLTIPNVTSNLTIDGFYIELNINDDKLVPVYYNGNDWIVADTETKWYSYVNQEWANAVVLNNSVSKSVGDTLDISSDVRAMFVWIPRYEYKISDDTNEVLVKFISSSQTTADNGYIIPPAFTFGTQILEGFWAGKFETSTDTTNSCYSSVLATYCNNTSLNINVLPNVKSLREQTISTQFTLARNFETNVGFSNLNSHMMKNIEWAAVAYLSQSVYGKFGNLNYSDVNKEIYVNNDTELYTGRSSGSPSYVDSDDKSYSYDYGIENGIFVSEENGIGASTTGNITGIYDMNGGAFEYMMGYLTTASSTFGATSIYDYADFTSAPESKYYDNYTSTAYSTACSGSTCYGHAFGETAGWYNDTASFLTKTDPWVMRSGAFDNDASGGIFYYSGTLGYSGSYATFRLSLTPTS